MSTHNMETSQSHVLNGRKAFHKWLKFLRENNSIRTVDIDLVIALHALSQSGEEIVTAYFASGPERAFNELVDYSTDWLDWINELGVGPAISRKQAVGIAVGATMAAGELHLSNVMEEIGK